MRAVGVAVAALAVLGAAPVASAQEVARAYRPAPVGTVTTYRFTPTEGDPATYVYTTIATGPRFSVQTNARLGEIVGSDVAVFVEIMGVSLIDCVNPVEEAEALATVDAAVGLWPLRSAASSPPLRVGLVRAALDDDVAPAGSALFDIVEVSGDETTVSTWSPELGVTVRVIFSVGIDTLVEIQPPSVDRGEGVVPAICRRAYSDAVWARLGAV